MFYTSKRTFVSVCILCILSILLLSCSSYSGGVATETPSQDANRSASNSSQKITDSVADNSSATSDVKTQEATNLDADSLEEDTANAISYPTGWLVAPCDAIDAGVPVEILYLPSFDVVPQINGDALSSVRSQELAASLPVFNSESALIRQGETIIELSPDYLLVNLPDLFSEIEYDVVYSYSSTSNCAGIPLPGITNERIVGYSEGKQPNAYVGKDCFVVPCAYRTAMKLIAVSSTLESEGYKLLVYDAYRPMRAQWALSESIETAYASNLDIQQRLGEWSINWYVANGPSGHNFGTDLDVGLCYSDGTVVEMPSLYDTFGGAGHLTSYPLDASSITPDSYTNEVTNNAACMTLHSAFVAAGFSELASEWWHFADDETEGVVQSIVGYGGLDFPIETVV